MWIQVGIGIWLMAAADGPWSRLAGLASAGWGLVVWVFGESFGGIFAPGLTWLFGAPGAVSYYCAAGASESPAGTRTGALPGWAGCAWARGRVLRRDGGAPGLAGAGLLAGDRARGTRAPGMTRPRLAQTPQPGFLAAWVRAFTSFDEAHGFAVNLFAVIALAVIGLVLLAARPLRPARLALLRAAVMFLAVLCLADWVLIEDFGFFDVAGPTRTSP